jgi:hypothetical protein
MSGIKNKGRDGKEGKRVWKGNKSRVRIKS